MTLDTERAVLLRYTRDGGWRRGSGLRIGGTLVLTAEHCAHGTDHMVVVDGQRLPRGGGVAQRSRRRGPRGPQRARYAGAAAVVVRAGEHRDRREDRKLCRAGIPEVERPTDTKRRAQADGYVATGEGADPHAAVGTPELLSFKITTPAIRDRPVEAGDLDNETTPWGGMSGAVIVTRRRADPWRGAWSRACGGGGIVDVHPAGGDRCVACPDGGRVLGAPRCRRPARPADPADAEDRAFGRGSWWARSRLPRRGLCTAAWWIGWRLGSMSATVAVVCALTGMRGVGKTQVAAAYARSWIEAGRGLVGWVNAETLDVAVADLARIAEAVGVADPEGDSARSAHRLVDHLATRAGESLLVFDNADRPRRAARRICPRWAAPGW